MLLFQGRKHTEIWGRCNQQRTKLKQWYFLSNNAIYSFTIGIYWLHILFKDVIYKHLLQKWNTKILALYYSWYNRLIFCQTEIRFSVLLMSKVNFTFITIMTTSSSITKCEIPICKSLMITNHEFLLIIYNSLDQQTKSQTFLKLL